MNKVIQGDCLEVMKDIPDKSIDMVITDPPYNMNINLTHRKSPLKTFDNENIPLDSHNLFIENIVKESFRVLKNDTCFYFFVDFRNYSRFYQIIDKYFDIKNCIVWDKTSIGAGWYYRFQHEFCIFAVKGKPKMLFTKRNQSDIMQAKRVRTRTQQHMTQKPIDLLERIIQNSCPVGGVVLDSCAGSGTTGVACKNLNRNYILIEKEPEYIDIINKRLYGI